jgi:energy-coupling factor transporter transmembrane protein EcfT
VNLFTEAFGGGNGAVRELTPPARLLCGAAVFAGCSVTPLTGWRGGALFAGAWLVWVVCCGLPAQRLAAALRFALRLFLPLLLLAPVARWTGEAASWRDALRPPLTLCARGIAGVTVSAATLSTLNLSEFARGVAALPLPRAAASLLVQLVHQTFLLADESQRMADALRVRGAPSACAAVRLRVLAALPVCWLTRIAARAARVGDAMEVRGFDGLPHGARRERLSANDRLALTLSLLAFGGALAIRWLEAACMRR